LFEDSDLVLNAAEKLEARFGKDESQAPRMLKIVNLDQVYAAISSSFKLYLMARNRGEERTQPILSPLHIDIDKPISDVALTHRSLMVLYGNVIGEGAGEIAEKAARMEYQKTQILKSTDYLTPEEELYPELETKLKAKKSSLKKRLNSPTKMGLVPQASNKTTESNSKGKGNNLNLLSRVTIKENSDKLLKELKVSDAVLSKFGDSFRINPNPIYKRTLETQTTLILDNLQKDCEVPQVELTKPPPAVLPSDFNLQRHTSISQVAFSHGKQSREVWMRIVNEGKQDHLIQNTLRYLVDKPIINLGKSSLSNQNLPTRKKLKPTKKVPIRGVEMESEARTGKLAAKELQKNIKIESEKCGKLLSLVDLFQSRVREL
jgi:hypothetical protein